MQKEKFWSKSKKVHTHFTVFCPFFSSNGHWPSAETFNGTFLRCLTKLIYHREKRRRRKKTLASFHLYYLNRKWVCILLLLLLLFFLFLSICCMHFEHKWFELLFFFLLFYSTNIQVWNKKEAVLIFPSFENECRNDFLFLDPHTKK